MFHACISGVIWNMAPFRSFLRSMVERAKQQSNTSGFTEKGSDQGEEEGEEDGGHRTKRPDRGGAVATQTYDVGDFTICATYSPSADVWG